MPPVAPSASRPAEDGFALLAVVVFLLVVTTMMTGFVLAARAGLDQARDGVAEARLDLLAEGLGRVAARAVFIAEATETAPPFALNASPAACREGDLTIQLQVQDQQGLVDLNAAGRELLVLALRSLGLPAAAAAEQADAILAYRTPPEDDAPPLADLQLRDGLKQAPFAAVEELHAFPVLAELPIDRLTGTFTVHSDQPRATAARLPAPLAAVLGRSNLLEDEASSGSPVRIDIFVRAGDDTLGYSGRIVEERRGEAVTLERSIAPGRAIAAPPDTVVPGCAALFGPGVTVHLREATA
ncbi:hypothetical protein ACK8OR_02740 [Jannaschia sp. KMU-145]|uniref:hypothetical protein n=1 Tax=Jannaschia halovivens TaxID=3388667 RepID=UPI00396B11BB